ncbi:MAG: CocE/NonD family hydrolase, partial [Sphingomicrobium sp.]
AVVCVTLSLSAQEKNDTPARFVTKTDSFDYEKREVMIPMRDGVKLKTFILVPKGAKNAPLLLDRTPYNAEKRVARYHSPHLAASVSQMLDTAVAAGYIIVFQDVRGKYGSEGAYVMTRPLRGPLNKSQTDHATDAYDTIDWLVKNVPESNGRVGAIGGSYEGFTTVMSTVDAHPALKVAVPFAPMVDGWMGDDWFHNGAFRTGGLDFAVSQSTGKAEGSGLAKGPGDDYTRYLEAGSMADYARRLNIENYPFVQKLFQNPAYTEFWSGQAVDKWMAAHPLTVPTLIEVGQWDQEDSYGGPAVYKALKEKYEGSGLLHLAIGPWRHSGANHYGYELGDITFTGDTAQEWRQKWVKPFFDHYLKDAPDPKTPNVLTYATGINEWQTSPRWPMGTLTPLYVGPNGAAGFDAPAAGHDDYVSDPAKPVPYLPRPIGGGQWKTWLVTDQRFVDGRPDVISYTTAPLTKGVHIMGAPQVDLYAATTGTDSDWVVKLIDVYPNEEPEGAAQGSKQDMSGFELPIGIEIFRGRYVDSFAKPRPLRSGKVEHYRWGLPNVNHVFLPGHRIMVQIQSSLFPVYDRNPQTFVPNIFYAKAADYRKATQSVYRGGATATSVLLPIVP